MSEGPDGRPAFSVKEAEIGVALLFFALGAIVIYDSVRLGAKWADEGPQAGYFPFYIGLIVCVSAAINLLRAFSIRPERDKGFVEVGQLKLVLTVLAPTALYVALIGWLGIYAGSVLFIAFFMRWLGRYAWWKAAAVSLGNSVVFFVIFEVWFKIPLPKGPLESLLGLN
ncbi:MAG: tripartite tricarboxylate transporter TctB family protein [Betaproteobacteria bacterium]|nr:tripartite tricarboxylate transporter TctB family protein [Betaproteobacteria bacterium]